MPFITYNPTSFTTPAYEDARSFAIWGVSWFTETDLSRLGPAAPAVVWMAPQTFNGGVRRSDHTGTTNLPTAVTSYIDKVKQSVIVPRDVFKDIFVKHIHFLNPGIFIKIIY